VVRIRNLEPLPNSDSLVGIKLFGMQAIYRMGILSEGDLVLLFPTECQLSQEFAAENNMYRNSEFIKNSKVTGYLEDNRRVKAIKLRGNRSDALVMPLHSIAYAIKDWPDNPEKVTAMFKEGDVFDTIDGNSICCKYIIPRNEPKTHSTPVRK